jgi:hypothetical protein
VAGDPKDETFNLFVGPWSKFSELDRVNDFIGKQGLNFNKIAPEPGKKVVATINGKNPTTGQFTTVRVEGWSTASEAALKKALVDLGYPKEADKSKVNYPMTLLILFIMLIYVTMVYGPIAAFLVELFPTNIRYTSMSLPYHIGNGWFGGMLPLIATAIVALKGNIYFGLWYPIIVALVTVVIGALFLKETKDRDITTYQHE